MHSNMSKSPLSPASRIKSTKISCGALISPPFYLKKNNSYLFLVANASNIGVYPK